MFQDLLTLIKRETEATRAWYEAVAVQSIDRAFTFSAFHESARYAAGRLRAAGLRNVKVVEAPADGKAVFADWRMPLAWDVEQATFDVIGPDGNAQRVADRSQQPCSLAMWSAPTPAKGVEADLVWIENAADEKSYPKGGVRGKIVFTFANPAGAKRVLAAQRALGCIAAPHHNLSRFPDAISWVNGWSDDPGGWAHTTSDRPGWAFLLSPRQGEQLLARVKKGEKLRGRAVVRSRLYAGTLPAVTGVIRGAGSEEVLILGHQFEEGAVDNASGVGAMIEAAGALQRLIDRGLLPAPKRSIRFLFMFECYGTLSWLEMSNRAKRTVAGLCLDGLGEKFEFAQRPLEVHLNPHSTMSYTDALLLALVPQVMPDAPTYGWRVNPFRMGTDSMIADSAIGIPCPWIGSETLTHHTSADTPDVLDATTLGLVARMIAAYAYLNANPDREQVLDFSYLAAARGKTELAAAGAQALDHLAKSNLEEAQRQLIYLAERHAEAAESPMRLLPRGERSRVRPQVNALKRELLRAGGAEAKALARRAGKPGHSPAPWQPEGELAAIAPRRLVIGPLTYDRLSPKQREGRPSPRWSGVLFSLLSWCDGTRSLAEACHLTARETAARTHQTELATPEQLARQIDPKSSSLLDYFEFLRRNKYVAW